MKYGDLIFPLQSLLVSDQQDLFPEQSDNILETGKLHKQIICNILIPEGQD